MSETTNSLHPPAWNTDWNVRCRACDAEFTSETVVRAGHDPWPRISEILEPGVSQAATVEEATHIHFFGRSKISLSGGESIHMECELWDHQPTIEIRVCRDQIGDAGEDRYNLASEARVVLSVVELQEILLQLQGPLEILMRRRPWNYDST